MHQPVPRIEATIKLNLMVEELRALDAALSGCALVMLQPLKEEIKAFFSAEYSEHMITVSKTTADIPEPKASQRQERPGG